jgi:hypothetical protein
MNRVCVAGIQMADNADRLSLEMSLLGSQVLQTHPYEPA